MKINEWNNKKFVIATATTMVIAVIVLVYTSGFVQAQIGLGRNESVNIDFQDDYEEILDCLNSKDWGMNQVQPEGDLVDDSEEIDDLLEGDLEEIAEDLINELEESDEDLEDEPAISLEGQEWEWTEADLDSLLRCLEGMGQIIVDETDVVDDFDDWDFDDLEDDFDDWEDELYLEIGFMGMIPMEDLNWDAFRDGDASDLVFVEIIEHNWESLFHFQPVEPEMAQILNWFYEHQDAFTSEEPVYFEFPEEITDEAFNRLIDEEGIIWMPRQVQIGINVDVCPYEQGEAPWREDVGSYCLATFYMENDLFERLNAFAWTLR